MGRHTTWAEYGVEVGLVVALLVAVAVPDVVAVLVCDAVAVDVSVVLVVAVVVCDAVPDVVSVVDVVAVVVTVVVRELVAELVRDVVALVVGVVIAQSWKLPSWKASAALLSAAAFSAQLLPAAASRKFPRPQMMVPAAPWGPRYSLTSPFNAPAVSKHLSLASTSTLPGMDARSHVRIPLVAGHAANARLSRPTCASQLYCGATASKRGSSARQ